MNTDQRKPIEEIQFDEFGQYEITEITDDQLDLVSGGDITNEICPNILLCPVNPPPPPAPPPGSDPPKPKPNKKCGEDGDEE